jgi:hypothetical protein
MTLMENKLSEAQGQYLFWKHEKKIFQKQDYLAKTASPTNKACRSIIYSLGPITSIQCAVLDRLRNMFHCNILLPTQIGNRTRYLQNSIMRPGT